MYDIIIIGSGAAGLAAGLYAGRYRLKILIIEGEFGGYTAKAGVIENYPGIFAVDGYELMETMKKQVEHVGGTFQEGFVEKIERDNDGFRVFVGDKTFQSYSIIYTVGEKRRELGLPNEKELTGRGVHYCMTCDGPVYTGKTLAVVGGGDASVKDINLAAEYVKKVYLIVRDLKIMAEPINYERMQKLGDTVQVLLNTQVKEIVGTNKLENIVLSAPHNGSYELAVDGLFVEIGAVPKTELIKPLEIALDEKGFVDVDATMRTNVDGFFAAGDIVNHFGRFKQDITAAAMGAVAATSAYEYSKTRKPL